MSKARIIPFATTRTAADELAPEPPHCRSIAQAVALFGEEGPIEVIYPERLTHTARRFLRGFPGRVMYAVKANPHPSVLRLLYEAGVTVFDVASTAEIDLVARHLPGARMCFMNPVKSRAAIRRALLAGVRSFAFDCEAELRKILEEAGDLPLELYLRIALPGTDAALPLSGKFGASRDQAPGLLAAARGRAQRLGITFHVGSQCERPSAFARAMAEAVELARAASVRIDALDVGGGFPCAYPDRSPPPLAQFFAGIRRARARLGIADVTLLCEPGRALVAEAGSILVRVDLRKGDALYVNDGTFGALFDAGTLGWRYPVRRVWRAGSGAVDEGAEGPLAPFRLFGPTCDSMDRMDGPFLLPEDIDEGDWIEIANLGAYGAAMRSAFNGFGAMRTVIVHAGDGRAVTAKASHSRPRAGAGAASPAAWAETA